MTNRVRIFTLLVAGSALASCGGEPNPTGPRPDDPQMTRVIKANPSFELDIQEIFVRTGCTESGCHGTGQAELYLLPGSASNYASIVNIPADRERSFLLVKPFDATNSYLVIRVENRQQVGGSMPPGGTLDSIDVANLRNWIDNGALDN